MDRVRGVADTTRTKPQRGRLALRVAAMTAASSLALFGGVTAAHAAPGDESNASARFLGGSILDLIPLNAIADLEGAAATNDGTQPTATDFNTLDVTALGAIEVEVADGIQIPIGGVDAGVVGQYASANPDGTSLAASGAVGSDGAVGVGPVPGSPPGPLTLDLSDAVDSLAPSLGAGVVSQLADLELTVDAVSATASLDGATGVARDYTIAGSTLSLTSPTVAGLTGAVDTAVGELQTTVDGLQGALLADLNSLLSVLSTLGVLNVSLEVGEVPLDQAVSGLLEGELTSPDYPGVTLNLETGEVAIDLAQIVDLNNLGPGEEILDGGTIDLISASIVGLVQGLVDDVVTELRAAIDTITIDVNVSVPPLLPGGTPTPLITVDTSVATLLGPTPTQGISVGGLALSLIGVDGIVTLLTTPVEALLDSVSATVGAVLTPVTTVLSPALDAVLPAVASLRANNQTEADGVYSETALILTVLPLLGADALTLELANATVGPNVIDQNADVTIETPAAGQPFIVPGPEDTIDVTVAGTGEPGAEITATIPGQPDQVATVDDEGEWTVVFPDLPVADYTATATQDVDGTTATVDFAVAEAPDVAITAPTDGQIVLVPGADDTADVTVTGTGAPGEDIEVELDGTTQTVPVADDGTWTAVFTGLPIGEYDVTATQPFDGSTLTVSFEVAEREDVVILAPADEAQIVVPASDSTADVTVSGSGDPGATVNIALTGQPGQSVPVSAQGEWTAVFDDLPTGGYVVRATQSTDLSTSTMGFVIRAADDVVITAPVEGETVFVGAEGESADVEVAGFGEAGETVEVEIPDAGTQSATVGADDAWSVSFDGLAPGAYTATATQSDGSVDTVSFTVQVAAGVEIETPAEDEQFGVADADGTADVTVTGTAQPGTVVTVALLLNRSQTTVADPDTGAFSVTFAGVGTGTYVANVSQEASDSTDSVAFSVVEIVDVAIDEPADGDTVWVNAPTDTVAVVVSGTGFPGETVTVTGDGVATPLTAEVDDDGNWSVTVPAVGIGEHTFTATQSGDDSTATVTVTVADRADVAVTSPADGGTVIVPDAPATITIEGEGDPGATVTVTIGDLPPVTTTVDEDGAWTVDVPNVPEGAQAITATQDSDGSTTSVDVTVDAAADVDIQTPTPSDTMWVDDEGGFAAVTVTGTGQPEAEITVTIPGVGTQAVTVSEEGTWSAEFTDVPEGATYTATAAQDIDGSTESVTFSVQAIADVAITSPEDGDPLVIPDAPGTITVEGEGQPGSTITVTVGDVPPVTTTVDDDGTWTIDVPGVPEGTHEVTAAQDSDGSTTTIEITVEAADDVVILTPTGGQEIAAGADGVADVTFTGTGQPGASVTVFVGTEEQTVPVNAAGEWAATFTDLPVGNYGATAEQDLDESSASVDFEITAALAAVAVTAPADGDALTVAETGETLGVDVEGTGEPDAEIEVELEGAGGGAFETTTVDGDGNWTVTFDDLEVGEYTVTATQDVDGSSDEVSFSIEVAAVDADAVDADAVDADAVDADAVDADVVDADAVDADAVDADAVDADVVDADAVDADAVDADAVDADAVDADAVDADAVDADAVDADAVDADAVDADAVDADAVDADAVDADAVDADAVDADAVDADAVDADAVDADAVDADADAVDADAVDADAVDADAVDADAVDADAVDADAVDADAVDADAVDADAVDADATDADAVDADATDADATDADATDADGTDPGEGEGALAVVTQRTIVRGTGQIQVVNVTGFQPGETVSATVNSTPFDLAPQVANDGGAVQFSFEVDASFELGAHYVDVRGSVTGDISGAQERTGFTVTGQILPVTGAELNGPLGGAFGLALLAVGAMLWGFFRRRGEPVGH